MLVVVLTLVIKTRRLVEHKQQEASGGRQWRESAFRDRLRKIGRSGKFTHDGGRLFHPRQSASTNTSRGRANSKVESSNFNLFTSISVKIVETISVIEGADRKSKELTVHTNPPRED